MEDITSEIHSATTLYKATTLPIIIADILVSTVELNVPIQETRDLYHLSDDMNGFDTRYIPENVYPWEVFAVEQGLMPNGISFILPYAEVTSETHTILFGHKAHNYLEDFYYRIHVSYSPLYLGTIISAQFIEVAVWNSYFIDNTLSEIAPTALDGVSISSTEVLPFTFNDLQNLIFSINVADKGSPYIDGYYTFYFATGDSFLYIIGQRAVVWPFIPIFPFTESKQWQTDILQLRSSEAKYQIREFPRMGISYTCLLDSQEKYSYARTLANNIVEYGIGLPQWSAITYVGQLSGGVAAIPCDTTYLELTDTQQIIIVYESLDAYDILEVDYFTADTIYCKTNTSIDFTDCYVAPVRIGYTQEGITISRMEKHGIIANVNLTNIVYSYYSPDWGTVDTYLGLPILETTPIVTGNITDTIQRPKEFFDSVTYGLDSYSPITYNKYQSQIRLYAHTKEEQYLLRRKIDYLKGKFASFWLPTYNRDLVATQPIALGINKLYVKAFGWQKYSEKYIRVQGSTTEYFQVIDVTTEELFPDQEVLLLSPTPTVDITNINKIDVIYKVRADADRFEYQYDSNIMKVTIPVIEEA